MEAKVFTRRLCLAVLCAFDCPAQIIEFESRGLKYQTLTKNGLTIMLAELPAHIREFSVLQVAVANGGRTAYLLRPEDFLFERADGSQFRGIQARAVVNSLIQKASRGDVIRLVTAYESGIYGNQQYKSTNGFEQRRQSALAEVGSAKIKAAAAASAIAFVPTKLAPGQSTDGAVFYNTDGKRLGAGVIRVRAGGTTFEFPLLTYN